MANTVIQLKRSSTPGSSPSTGNLANGELAINFADGVIYYKNLVGQVAQFTAPGKNYGTVNANGTLLVSGIAGDVFTILPGQNITVVGDAVNDRVTIGADLTSANGWANTKLANTSGVSFAGDLYFPTGNVAIGQTSAPERLTVFRDTDNSAEIGKAHVGFVGYTSYAGFSHINMNGVGNYALLQGPSGETFLNSASGQAIYFRQNNTDRMILDYLGNLGIGTTGPNTLLHIYKGNTAAHQNFIKIEMPSWAGSAGYNKNIVWHDGGGDVAGIGAYFDGTSVNFSFHSMYNGGLKTASNSVVNIMGTGRVGIGNTAPGVALEVTGSIRSSQSVTIGTGGTYQPGSIYSDSNWGMLYRSGTSSPIQANFAWKSQSDATEYMRIDPTGNVGIGSTSPGTKLEIKGIDSAISFDISGSGSSALPCIGFNRNVLTGGIYNSSVSGWQFSARDSYFALEGYNGVNTFASASGSIITATKANAFVGIGTTAPSQRLTVAGGQILVGPTDNGNSYVNFYSTLYRVGANSGLEIQTASGDVIRFLRGSTESARIDSSGNMGIGTTSPQTKLDVRGVIQGSSYTIPDTSGSYQWVKLGTLTTAQQGYTAHIRAYIHAGYNALNSQDFYVDIFFKTSNGASVDSNGFAGNSWYYGTGFQLHPIGPKWVGNAAGVSATSYDLYLYLPSFTLRSHYKVEIPDGATWVHTGTIGQTDPGSSSNTVCVSSAGYNILYGNVGIGTTTATAALTVATGDIMTTVDAAAKIGWNRTGKYFNWIECDGVGGNNYMRFATGNTEAMRITSGGNVGIGSDPAFTSGSGLEVERNGVATIRIQNTSFNASEMRQTGSQFELTSLGVQPLVLGTNNTERLRITSNGNIGIGTSAPIEYNNTSISMTIQGPSFASINLRDASSTTRTELGAGSTESFLKSVSSLPLTFYTNNVERMRLDTNGNLGIGTTTPLYSYTRLHLARTGYAQQVLENTTDSIRGEVTVYDTTLPMQVGTITSHDLILSTAAVRRMTITAAGNVGIGTSAPQTRLHVGTKITDDAGYTYDSNTFMAIHQSPTGTSRLNDPKTVMMLARQGWGGEAYGAAVAFDLSRYENSGVFSRTRLDITLANNNFIAQNTTVMTLLSGGNVGIGTTAPSAKLQISNAGSFTAIRATNTTDSVQFDAIAGSTAVAIGAATSHPLVLNTGNTERMRITSDGNVGIGTTTPAYKLQVNGSFAATTKSFVIDHPTKPGMKLRHGSLEGPENGVYIRGKVQGKVIELPEYWIGLVDAETITVQLTAIGRSQNPYVVEVSNNNVFIDTENHTEPYCYFTIYGERKDVEKLVVEY